MKTRVRTKKTASHTTSSWERAGEVGVDSGQLMVCDPCYVDSQWKMNQEPTNREILVLSSEGRKKFPGLTEFRAQFPFDWGTYEDQCPELGMSVNDARTAGLLDVLAVKVVREFSYRGACDVSCREGEEFGQLNYEAGHAGAGVAFSSGYGDGVYQVFVRRNEDGRIVEARIIMEPDEQTQELFGIKQ